MLICSLTNEFDWTLIATFATAVATFFTVREIKKQRQQSNMPNIVLLPNKRFYLYRATSLKNYQYLYWHETHLQEANQVETVRHMQFDIDIFNIGIGSAKNVKFKYFINTKEHVKFLNELGIVNVEKLDLESDALSFSAKYGNDMLGISVGKIDIDFTQTFIPKSDVKASKLKLPMIYLSLFNAFILSILSKQDRFDYYDKFPSLNLSMSYQDIANKKYKKNFKIFFILDCLSINTNREPSFVGGTIMIDEKN
jgi:hypothetical protein